MKKIISFTIIVTLLPVIVLAISSTNFDIEPLNVGNSGGINGSSSNYNLEQQQVGDVTIDLSNSSNYNLRHGHLYQEDDDVKLSFVAIPEKRIPSTGNDGTKVIIYVYSVGSQSPLHSYFYYDTDNNGNYSNLELTGLSAGTYDLAIKGYSHLIKRVNNINLNVGNNFVDFTNASNDKLLCGDLYTNGIYPNGDNKVNSVDVTYLVSKWALEDFGVSDERADVDENHQVNSLDITKVVNNYALIGD